MPHPGFFLFRKTNDRADKENQINAWLQEGGQFYEYEETVATSIKTDDGKNKI